MKRIYQFLLVAVAVIGINTSCSDVPAPYEVNPGTNGGGKTLPYKSTALNTGWTMHCISANEPWSQGSSYIQATGYQDWEGTGAKSNVEVESYLISPAFNTACESGKVRFYFCYVDPERTVFIGVVVRRVTKDFPRFDPVPFC